MRAGAHPPAAFCRRAPAPAGGGAIVGGRSGPAARAPYARRLQSPAPAGVQRPTARRAAAGPSFPAPPGFRSASRPALASSMPPAVPAIVSPFSRTSIALALIRARARAAALPAGPGGAFDARRGSPAPSVLAGDAGHLLCPARAGPACYGLCAPAAYSARTGIRAGPPAAAPASAGGGGEAAAALRAGRGRAAAGGMPAPRTAAAPCARPPRLAAAAAPPSGL